MGFDFSATAQCDYCGNYMNSSDKECEHGDSEVLPLFFRHVSTDELTCIRSTPEYKWQKLANSKGEDWIAWVFIGRRSLVSSYLERTTVDDIPSIAFSVDARIDVEVDSDE